jgi:SNF2 family DNA or RNA helicase
VDVEYRVDGDELELDLTDPRADRKRAWRQLRDLGAPLELEPTAATVKARVPREGVDELESTLGMLGGELVPADGQPSLDDLEDETPSYEEVRPVEPEDVVDAALSAGDPEPVRRAIADLGTFAHEHPSFEHRVERDKRYLRRALETLEPDDEPEEDEATPDPVKQAVSERLRTVPDEDTWRARDLLLDLREVAERFDDERPTVEVPDDIPGFRGELRGYQREGVSFLLGAELNAVLADDMGTGKTIHAIAATLLADARALVVCPANVLHNWAAEIERFTGEQAAIWHGRDVDDREDARFRVTTYTSLRYRDWRDTDIGTRPVLVLDEAHKVRNPETQRARLVRDLPQDHRVLLTGTPIVNGLEDYHELLLHVGEERWPDRESFRDTWMQDREVLTHPEVRQATADLLQRATRHVVLRRRKDEVLDDLPERTVAVTRHPLDDEDRRTYEDLERSARETMRSADSSVQVFAQLHKLRQHLLDNRLDALEDRLRELIEAGERVVVYAEYLDALDELEDAFPEVSARIDGDTPPTEREAISRALGEPEGPRVLLAQTEAGGVGLNFTGARFVLFAHLAWTAAAHRQAIDRVHRIGQDEPVHVEFFVTPQTIDERLVDLILEKEADANLALADEDTILDRDELAEAMLREDDG